MAKKNAARKRGLADKVRNKKASVTQKVNPFEVKINRQKHDVLGKKVAKHDRGRPGVARSKAVQKRKETLLVEYKKRGKVNKFVDRRFGETDPEMSLEDKMLHRFALERQRTHEKPSTFSLNDEDEGLTHYGQSLSEIEKFDEPDISDDENDRGILEGDLVTEEHFGGFLTKKKVDSEQPVKPWKERMEEIIAKSKKQKFERQSEKEKTAELTEKLDEDWKTLRGAMVSSKRTKESEEPKSKADDYDIMVRELQFDIRGKATDRLKTEEEIAKEEHERLEKLENDRLRRMRGEDDDEELARKVVFRSADDLDDGFVLDKSVKFEAAYSDGKLIQDFDRKAAGKEEEDSGDGEDDEESEDEDSDEEDDSETDEGSDLESSEDDDDDDDEGEHESETEPTDKSQVSKPKSILKNKAVVVEKKLSEDETKEKLKKKKASMEKASKELPYTFPAPRTYEDLLHLLEGHSSSEQLTIIERIQKLYHPSLAEGNKEKLQGLYALLLQYVADLCLQDPPDIRLVDQLVKPLYQLTQLSPLPAASTWVQLLKDRQEDFSEVAERRSGRGLYPSLDMLVLLKLVAALFPTSDFRHPVVTPAMLYMGQILAQCPVKCELDVASGLFLCTVFLQYVSLSKRLVPEAINFLCGVLFLTIEKLPDKYEKVPPPFKPVGKNIDLLRVEEKCKSYEPAPLGISKVFSSEGQEFVQSYKFKVCALHQCLGLVDRFSDLYQKVPSFVEIFQPLQYFMGKINLKKYPNTVKNLHKEVTEKIKSLVEKSTKTSLVRPKTRPKPLQTFEPKFEEVFDGKKKRAGSREHQEKQRLLHKHKKELKGAVRNLRQDNQFLAREKLREQMDRDAERKRKVKELYAELANQEGDFKAMKRAKDKV